MVCSILARTGWRFSGRGTSRCDEIVRPHDPPMARSFASSRHGEGRDDARQERLIIAVPGSNALAWVISDAVLEILGLTGSPWTFIIEAVPAVLLRPCGPGDGSTDARCLACPGRERVA